MYEYLENLNSKDSVCFRNINNEKCEFHIFDIYFRKHSAMEQ